MNINNVKQIINTYNNCTIKDDNFEPMVEIEDVISAFKNVGIDLKLPEYDNLGNYSNKSNITKLDNENCILTTISKKKTSCWISFELTESTNYFEIDVENLVYKYDCVIITNIDKTINESMINEIKANFNSLGIDIQIPKIEQFSDKAIERSKLTKLSESIGIDIGIYIDEDDTTLSCQILRDDEIEAYEEIDNVTWDYSE